uniref:Uncharacterized protein n=1 Tax=Peronospora matthiolae TaxID=2874970 RepID=A0AAV1UIE0_9STRA
MVQTKIVVVMTRTVCLWQMQCRLLDRHGHKLARSSYAVINKALWQRYASVFVEECLELSNKPDVGLKSPRDDEMGAVMQGWLEKRG